MLTMDSPSAADEEPLPFTPDQQEEIMIAVKKIQQNLAMIPFHFKNGGVSRFVADSVMNITEFEISNLGNLLGVNTDAETKLEERHGKLRKANMRIHELERLIGQNFNPQAIQPALKTLCQQINGWWDLEGFGLISDLSFGEYNLKAVFSCQFISIRPHIENTEHLPRKERFALWLKQLQAQGFRLLEDSGDKGIQDCEASRQALRDLFARRFDSAFISSFVSRETKNGSHLTGVEVYIRDITEIFKLPVPAEQDLEI